MPGICGIVDVNEHAEAGFVLDEMIVPMQHEPWYLVQRCSGLTPGVELAQVSLGNSSAMQIARLNNGTRTAVMDGELYDADHACRELRAAGCHVDEDHHAEILMRGVELLGAEFLRRLHGSFVAAVWDAPRRQLTLVNDRFGMRPLYYAQIAGRLVFASSIKALLADSQISRQPSTRGITQFFTFGQYLQNDTSLSAVDVLPAATVAVFDADRGKLSLDPYWRLAEAPDTAALSDEDRLVEIDEAFGRAVDRRVAGSSKLGLALSGGLDARTILGAIDPRRNPVISICYSVPGSLDHRCSRRMAELVGGEYHHYPLDASFLANFEQHMRRMVQLTDGQYLSQCIMIPTLSLYRELGLDVLLRGHAGELMHMQKAYAYSVDDEALAARDDAAIENWMFRHLQSYMLDAVDRPLLAPEFQQALESAPRESLQASLRECRGADRPVQQIWRHFLTQRLRRETALSMTKFGSVVETRLPFMDNDLVDLLLAAPPEMKVSERMEHFILRKRNPALLSVINANTGAKMGASRFVREFSTLKNRVLTKLRVPGYQPYEQLGLWLRRELAPTVRGILLSEQCLDRGIFDADGVRDVIDNHLVRKRNCTFLLLSMMIFELGQRYLLDEEQPSTAPSTADTRVSAVL